MTAATIRVSLNAPFGARCFLTFNLHELSDDVFRGLNAPFGAFCFLTLLEATVEVEGE